MIPRSPCQNVKLYNDSIGAFSSCGGGQMLGAALSDVLQPGHYVLVLTTARAREVGPFRLDVSVPSGESAQGFRRLGCSELHGTGGGNACQMQSGQHLADDAVRVFPQKDSGDELFVSNQSIVEIPTGVCMDYGLGSPVGLAWTGGLPFFEAGWYLASERRRDDPSVGACIDAFCAYTNYDPGYDPSVPSVPLLTGHRFLVHENHRWNPMIRPAFRVHRDQATLDCGAQPCIWHFDVGDPQSPSMGWENLRTENVPLPAATIAFSGVEFPPPVLSPSYLSVSQHDHAENRVVVFGDTQSQPWAYQYVRITPPTGPLFPVEFSVDPCSVNPTNNCWNIQAQGPAQRP